MNRGFTKLFNTIVTSTIWQEDDQTRIVWITMLAISDAQGLVSAAIPGLANVAKVPVEATRKAVQILEDPDPDSRTEENEGRRIQKVEGGWQILNYLKYRRMLNEEERREYKAKWIAEKRKCQHVSTEVDAVDSVDGSGHKQRQKHKEKEEEKESVGLSSYSSSFSAKPKSKPVDQIPIYDKPGPINEPTDEERQNILRINQEAKAKLAADLAKLRSA